MLVFVVVGRLLFFVVFLLVGRLFRRFVVLVVRVFGFSGSHVNFSS